MRLDPLVGAYSDDDGEDSTWEDGSEDFLRDARTARRANSSCRFCASISSKACSLPSLGERDCRPVVKMGVDDKIAAIGFAGKGWPVEGRPETESL